MIRKLRRPRRPTITAPTFPKPSIMNVSRPTLVTHNNAISSLPKTSNLINITPIDTSSEIPINTSHIGNSGLFSEIFDTVQEEVTST